MCFAFRFAIQARAYSRVPRRQAPGFHCQRCGGFVQCAVHVREFPQARQQTRVRTLPQSRFAVLQKEKHRFVLAFPGLLRGFYRQRFRRAPKMPQTDAAGRTEQAFWRAVRHADRCPQLHHGLIENPHIRIRFRQNGLYLPADAFFCFWIRDIRVIVRHPRYRSEDVAVNGGLPAAKCRRHNGRRGVFPYAGQCQKARVVLRKAAAGCDLLRRLLQISGAAVIAQSLPELHQGFFRRVCQSLHRREGF